MHHQVLGGYAVEPYASDGRDRSAEVPVGHAAVYAHGLEQPRAAVRAHGGDAHLGHYLQETFVDRLEVHRLRGVGVHLDAARVDHVLDRGECEVRIHRVRAVSDEEREVHYVPRLSGFDDQGGLQPLLRPHQVLVHGGQCE